MKAICAAFAVLFCISGRGFGQVDADAPIATELVRCGVETVAVFDEMISADGKFALAWTIRPKTAGAKPVDWSDYKFETRFDWLGKYPSSEPGSGSSGDDYYLVDGVVDLGAKTFTALTTTDPYFPHFNHRELWVAWSPEKGGRRYAVATNEARFSTINLWLVSIDAGGVRSIDLTRTAEEAVRRYVKKKEPRVKDGYVVAFVAGVPSEGGNSIGDPFERDGSKVKVRYYTEVPKSFRRPKFQGNVTVALPSGKILRVDGEDEGDDSAQ